MVRASWFVCAAVGLKLVRPFPLPRHIDGQDYMWAVSEILDSARDVIFILVGVPLLVNAFFSLREYGQDWWLTPELYLRYVIRYFRVVNV